MCCRFILGLNLSFFSVGVFAQTKICTLNLYYAINEVTSPVNYSRLDSLYATLGTNTTSISIYGYADFLNTAAYNLNLSKKRADAVKNYFLKKKRVSNISVIICEGLGERNSRNNKNAKGDSSQRKVEVIVKQETTYKKIGSHENIVQDGSIKENSPEKKNLEDLEKGESLAIEGLNFIPGRHFLVSSALPVLEKLLKTLKDNPNLKIEIQGHICCVAGDGDNIDIDTHDNNLSRNRALTVYHYLLKHGIDKERLSYKGYGHSKPLIEFEKSVEDEQMNRRVEIKIVES